MTALRLPIFLLCAVLAACDATAPDVPAPPSQSTSPAPAPFGKQTERDEVWAFPAQVEQSRIVFTDFDTEHLRWESYKVNIDGSGLQRFDFPKDNPGDEPDIIFQSFHWHPDGRSLVYRGSNTNTDNWYLVLVDSSGTRRRLLTDIGGFADHPAWRPQGDRILYERGGFYGGQLGTLFQTAIVDTLGNSVDFFVNAESRFFEGDSIFFALFDDGNHALYDAEWAPDGDHLYLAGVIGKRPTAGDVTPGDVELFKVETATGRVVERLTHNDIDERGFILSPDGKRALLPRGDRAPRIYLMDLSSAIVLPLTDEPHENPPRWAADSRHILYGKRGGIYLLDADNPVRERRITDGFDADIFTVGTIHTGIERR